LTYYKIKFVKSKLKLTNFVRNKICIIARSFSNFAKRENTVREFDLTDMKRISRLVSFSTRYAVRPTTSSDGVLRPRAQSRSALETESRETSLHGWSILLTHALYKSCKVHTKDNRSRPDVRIC